MSDNVTEVDFGREKVEAARRLGRLLGLIEKREASILADPVSYFDKASEEICRLRRVVRLADDALRIHVQECPSPAALAPMQTITVMRDEWERMKRAVDILREAAR